jgi:hypothetical protein
VEGLRDDECATSRFYQLMDLTAISRIYPGFDTYRRLSASSQHNNCCKSENPIYIRHPRGKVDEDDGVGSLGALCRTDFDGFHFWLTPSTSGSEQFWGVLRLLYFFHRLLAMQSSTSSCLH